MDPAQSTSQEMAARMNTESEIQVQAPKNAEGLCEIVSRPQYIQHIIGQLHIAHVVELQAGTFEYIHKQEVPVSPDLSEFQFPSDP